MLNRTNVCYFVATQIYDATKGSFSSEASRDNLASAFRAVYIPTFYPSKIGFWDRVSYFFNGDDKRKYWDDNDLPTEAKLNECCSKELEVLKNVGVYCTVLMQSIVQKNF